MSKSKRVSNLKSSPKIKIESNAKNLTNHAGVIPVMKFLERLRFTKAFVRTVEHDRGSQASYQLVDAVTASILGVIAGARSMDGIAAVWSDDVLRKLSGWRGKMMDATTLGRIFKTVKNFHASQMITFNHKMRGRTWKLAKSHHSRLVPYNSMWVDVDSTVKTACGNQEGVEKGYNPHKRGARSYHPQLAFCAETKEILQGWLRCGSAYTSNGVVEFMKELLAHVPRDMRIVFRGDSGYFVGALFDLLEERGCGFLVKVKLKGLVGLLEKQTWEPIPGKRGWEQTRFSHGCGTWSSKRQFVAVRQLKENEKQKQPSLFLDAREFDYFCYVTTEDLTPWQAHKKYGKRATCETWIEEAKNQMALAHIKTNSFLANDALFQSTILAYNTIRWMALVSGDQQLIRWEPASLRTFMLRVAGKLVSGGRQLTLKTSESALYPQAWQSWLRLALE
ncbi:MAG: IS1380 family transposase [bacterium]